MYFLRYFDSYYNKDMLGVSVELQIIGSEIISDATKHVSEFENKRDVDDEERLIDSRVFENFDDEGDI